LGDYQVDVGCWSGWSNATVPHQRYESAAVMNSMVVLRPRPSGRFFDRIFAQAGCPQEFDAHRA